MAERARRAGRDGSGSDRRRLDRLHRLRVGVSSHVRSFVRTPANVALLVVVPIIVIEGYAVAMQSFPRLSYLSARSMADLGRINGAVYAAAFLAGVLGLFQIISAVQADERLRVCGYTRPELFASRLASVALGSVLVAGVAATVLWYTVEPAAPLAAFGALALAALVYGLIGMVVGAALPRALEGSLVLVFLVDFDDFLSSGILDIDAEALKLLPLHYPHRLLRSAVFDGTVETGNALAGGAYLVVLLAMVLALYVRLTGEGGVLS